MFHVIDCLARGGAETLLLNTISRLPDHEHILVTISDKFEFDESVKSGLQYHTLHCSTKAQWPAALLKLRKLIRKYRPDLVHTHLHAASVLTKMACPRDIPLFYSIHTVYSNSAFSRNLVARRLERLTARPYHHLIGVSGFALDDYVRQVPRSGSRDVLYNFVDDKFFAVSPPPPYVPGEPLRCVSIGNLKYQKNYYYTLENFAKIKDLPITLDIYGKGPEEQKMRKVISDLSLDNVHIREVVRDVEKVLPAYHVYIINSTLEGFGIAPLEAMAARVPAIVSDNPTFREVIGDAAIQVQLEQPGSLAGRLTQIFKGEIDLKEYAGRGYNKAMEVSHSGQYIRKLVSIYEKYR